MQPDKNAAIRVDMYSCNPNNYEDNYDSDMSLIHFVDNDFCLADNRMDDSNIILCGKDEFINNILHCLESYISDLDLTQQGIYRFNTTQLDNLSSVKALSVTPNDLAYAPFSHSVNNTLYVKSIKVEPDQTVTIDIKRFGKITVKL